MTAHECFVSYCRVQIPETFLMCKQHWDRVPKDLQLTIWRLYRERARSSAAADAHLKACIAARDRVERDERGMFA